jgi:hypothetical protein
MVCGVVFISVWMGVVATGGGTVNFFLLAFGANGMLVDRVCWDVEVRLVSGSNNSARSDGNYSLCRDGKGTSIKGMNS